MKNTDDIYKKVEIDKGVYSKIYTRKFVIESGVLNLKRRGDKEKILKRVYMEGYRAGLIKGHKLAMADSTSCNK